MRIRTCCCSLQRSLATTTVVCRTRASTSSLRRTLIVVADRGRRRRRPVLPGWPTVPTNTGATLLVARPPGTDRRRRRTAAATSSTTRGVITARPATQMPRLTGARPRHRALGPPTTGEVGVTPATLDSTGWSAAAAVRRRRRKLTVSNSRDCSLRCLTMIHRLCLQTRTPSMTNCRSLRDRSSR